MPGKDKTAYSWWQPQKLAIDACQHYRLGPLNIYLQRQNQQWLLAREYTSDDMQQEPVIESIPMIPLHLTSQRFLFNKSPDTYQLLPRLMNRPVVVKTLQPVHLPPGEQTTLYISSPVSLSVMLKDPDMSLQNIPVQRLSDTWFGPSTQVGELCYADKTHARHAKADLPLRSHRAITPVTVHNRSTQMLSIDKVSIPVPFLALYALPDGNLWTDPITLSHEGLQALAHFRTGKLSAAEAIGATLLSEPSQKPEKHNLVRAFTDIFSD